MCLRSPIFFDNDLRRASDWASKWRSWFIWIPGSLWLLTCSIISPYKKRFRFASVLSKPFRNRFPTANGTDFVLVWLMTILLWARAFLGFSPKRRRNKGAQFERSQMSLSCWYEIGSPLYRPRKKEEIETTRFYNNLTQGIWSQEILKELKLRFKVICLHEYFW